MSTVLNTPKRKCDVLFNGPIAELQFLNGPLYGCRLTTQQIERMVSNGKKVWEINPKNPSEKVLLTIASCGKSAFANNNEPSGEETVHPSVSDINPADVIVPAEETPVVPTTEIVEDSGKQNEIPSFNKFNKKDKKNKHNHNSQQNNNQHNNWQGVSEPIIAEEKAVKKEEAATEETVVSVDAVM